MTLKSSITLVIGAFLVAYFVFCAILNYEELLETLKSTEVMASAYNYSCPKSAADLKRFPFPRFFFEIIF